MKPLQRMTAEVLVKVLAVYTIVSGALCVMYSIFFPLLMSSLPAQPDKALPVAVFILIGIFLFIIGVLIILLGKGLWQFKNWARITQIVLTWIGVAFSVLWIVFMVIVVVAMPATEVQFPKVPFLFMMVFVIIFSACYNGAILWLLQFEPTVKSLFTGQPAPANKKQRRSK